MTALMNIYELLRTYLEIIYQKDLAWNNRCNLQYVKLALSNKSVLILVEVN